MRKIRDFRCGANHVTEHYVRDDVSEVMCPVCENLAQRIISPVRCQLDHTFPGQSMKWEKEHEKHGTLANAAANR